MLTEDVDITLENLLNLALGTPEIGAVNFNYLHEVVTEILKHLGISKKLVGITQEVDYRLLNSTKPSNHEKKNLSKDSIVEVPQQPAIASTPGSGDDVGTVEVIDNTVNNSSEGSEVANPTKEPGTDDKDRRQASVAHVPTPPTQRRSSIVTTRRSSTGNSSPRLAMKDSKKQDIAIVNRTIERRDSKTPAGDMWHVLNINRRVEAAEAAIQGMTNLIDTINSDMQDLKNIQQDSAEVLPTETQEVVISKQDHEEVNKIAAKLKSYDSKINELEEKLDAFITEDQIKSFCTVDEVHAMFLEKIDSLIEPEAQVVVAEKPVEPDQVQHDQTTVPSVQSVAPAVAPLAAPSIQQVKQQPKVSAHLLQKQLSRDNMLYREMSKKMMQLEQEMKQTKERLAQLESDQHLQVSRTTDENANSGNDTEVLQINQQIEGLASKVTDLEAIHHKMATDILNNSSQNEDLTAEQKSLTLAFQKLERNLEDMSDNFHRTQSNLSKRQQSTSQVDEGMIMRINGVIFEMQQQQSTFQNEVDALSNMVTKKDERMDELNKLIMELQDSKVDKEYVNMQLDGKAERKLVENKVSHDHFDGCIGEIDRNIQEMLQKFDEMTSTTSQEFTSLRNSLSQKTDHEELNEIKAYIDNRFKTFKPKMPIIPQNDESTPAATRKKLLPGCNCISCDRTVDVPATHAGLVLPGFQPLPGMQSVRPVTTFDLQTMRQQMHRTLYGSNRDRHEMTRTREKLQKELLQLCGVGDLDELVAQSNRSCGGVHTLVEQHRRNPGKLPIFYREEHASFQQDDRQLFETDVLGRDGHIYKGRIQSPALPQIKKQGQNTDNQIMPRPSMMRSASGKISPKPEMV